MVFYIRDSTKTFLEKMGQIWDVPKPWVFITFKALVDLLWAFHICCARLQDLG